MMQIGEGSDVGLGWQRQDYPAQVCTYAFDLCFGDFPVVALSSLGTNQHFKTGNGGLENKGRN